MYSPFNYFDAIYCINLDHRKDRWETVSKEFWNWGLENRVTRIPGTVVHDFDNPKRNACYGNHLSHAKCLDDALVNKYHRILIFEDDVKFINNPIDVLMKATQQLPPFWDLFYLGANLERPAYQVTENLAKLTFAYSTHAYAVNMMNQELVDLLLKINRNPDTIHNDVKISEVIPYFCSFICIPMVAIQSASYSDIEKGYMDYSWMEDRFNTQLVKKDVGNKTVIRDIHNSVEG